MKFLSLPKACGVVEKLSGAQCTLVRKHEPPHVDASEPGCLIQFKDVSELIVPDLETGIFDVPIMGSYPISPQDMDGF